MADSLRTATLVAAALTMGLSAGLFAAFAYAVMPGLRRAGDAAFITGMQRINESILNAWFAVCFGGAALLTAAALALHLGAPARRPLPWIAAGLVLYVAVLVVTFAVNVPLNDRLAAAGDVADMADPAAVRARFEPSWVAWNVVRAVASTAAFGCLLWAVRLG
jgi:uncharacterized membrane protein